jgi:hypothetical protein
MASNNQTKSKESNARGGARKGAGRKPGAATQRTRVIADRAMAEGITPLEYMLQVMRTEPSPDMDARDMLQAITMRFEAAKAAAPYIHPRLAAIEHSGPNGGPIAAVTASLTPKEFQQIAKQIADEV